MELIVNFPCFSIIMSLMGAVVCSVLPKRGARALATTLIGCGLAMSVATLVRGIVTNESVTFMMGHHPAPWGNEIRFGIFEPLFASLFSLVLLLCLLGGNLELESKTASDRRHLYYTMVMLIQASLYALSYTNDIFTGYVFIEICTIASCGILLIRGSGRAITAATRYMIFSLMGSGLFLLGVVMLYAITGHLLMPSIRQAMQILWEHGDYRLPMKVTISLMVVGVSIKTGLFPFHFWMADTYGTALPGSAGILSGIISKGYIVLLIKIIYQVLGTEIFYARSRMVCAARACGVDVYDTPFTDVEDIDGLYEDARFAKSLGFTGKASISPRHVEGINEVFSPTQAEIDYAHEVLETIRIAKEQGKGVVALRGKMIDAPIVMRAQRTIDTAKALGLGKELCRG